MCVDGNQERSRTPIDLKSCRSLSSFPLAGKTPHQAVKNCLDPLSLAASCVTRDVLVASGSDVDKLESLAINRGSPSRLRGRRLYLTVKMLYRVTEADGERGPWKVSTAAYFYALHDERQREIIAFHWHPETENQKEPHLHVYPASNIMTLLAKVHLPTGRITLEQFLRFLIIELDVKPLRNDWERVLAGTERRHLQYRTWG